MTGVDADRLARRFAEMSAIGRTPAGGVHRPALTDADKACRDLLLGWCEAAGLPVKIDQVGNMFATAAGRDPDLPPLLVGSHLDSQPYAGAFDGPAGVLAALEAIETLNERGVAMRMSVQLVNWSNEEGARFRPPLLGSAVFAGLLSVEAARAVTDNGGRTFGGELDRIGYAGPLPPGWPISGYIEIHIEQGTVLERAGAVIGIVSGGVGLVDTQVVVTGEDAHAGPLEMAERRDALLGAAEMIVAANGIGLAGAPEARVTVGRIKVPSDSHSVVPGRAEFTLDLRHPEPDALAEIESRIRSQFRDIAAARNLEVAFAPLWSYPPFTFDATLRRRLSEAAEAFGYPQLALPSRAGHDAWNMARIAPSAMVFIPCRAGISHNAREFAELEHMAASANVLLKAILDLDKPC